MSAVRFRDQPIARKVLSLVALAVLALVVVAGVSITRMSSMRSEASALYHDGAVPLQSLGDLRSAVALTRNAVSGTVSAPDAATLDEVVGIMKKQIGLADAALASLKENVERSSNEELQAPLATFEQGWAGYRKQADEQLVPLARAHDVAGWWAARPAILPFGAQMDEGMSSATDLLVEQAAALDDDAASVASQARTVLIATVALAIAAMTALGLLVSRMIARPIRQAVAVVERVGAGDLTASLDLDTHDEVGQMAVSLNGMVLQLRGAMTSIAKVAGALNTSSTELAHASDSMAQGAEETSAQAETVSAASEEVTANIATVAAATEEMTVSITEIAKSAADVAGMSDATAELATRADEAMAELDLAAADIGTVVKLITDIAAQTNLLALNATIEAARAGEAGRGFAVVANEVKDLALETAKATSAIGHRVEGIQSSTTEAIQAIARVTTSIEQIRNYTTTIASAVEEQSATTREIGMGVQEAATGAGSIAESMTTVATSSASTSSGAMTTRRSAGELASLATELHQAINRFQVV